MKSNQRKRIRLQGYDYSSNGYYFITICTKSRKQLLSHIVGDGLCAVPQTKLTNTGKEIEKSIQYIGSNLNNVKIDKFIIMPNHIHMIIVISAGGDGTPPLQNVIRRFKSYTTNRFNEIFRTTNETLWQRSYYDHIIRNEEEYLEIWEYIDTNPCKWQNDEYYND